MADLLQVVDSISASPDVLINLANKAGLSFKNFTAHPPQLRRTTSSSAAGDGDVLMAASYAGREIEFDLNVIAATNDANSTQLQLLARTLANGDAWIKFQKDGTTNPVFFRTKRADITSIQEFWSTPGTRVIHLSIPCDPFAYGLPETGSFTITNNPTTGTNKMMYSFGEIMGDVSTPLHLTFPTMTAAHRIHVSSQAAFDGTTLTAPYYKALSAEPKNLTPPGTQFVADVADADFVSGTARQLAGGTAGVKVLTIPTAAQVLTWDNLPAGDYRVFVRLQSQNFPGNPAELLFFNRPPANGATYVAEEAAARSYQPQLASNYVLEWADMGVVSMPGGAPITDTAFDLPGSTGPAVWQLAGYYGSVIIELDVVVLVPAGRPDTVTRHGSSSFPVGYTSKNVTLDGVTNRRFATGISTLTAGVTSTFAPDEVAGSHPIVVPSANNTLHFFASTSIQKPITRHADDKATTTLVNYKYYPRYLYDRPATT